MIYGAFNSRNTKVEDLESTASEVKNCWNYYIQSEQCEEHLNSLLEENQESFLDHNSTEKEAC